ncbi:DUF4349 domain-containing protein [Miltoncostaea oceani]|uniref:DUF4349 domain-containing protein n=1 Tax=Miltoncostaea oceani TaxID=2843216 RepID=UPI001C3E269C|nr:DUF4349 domain-containing protein [Miltoncostaea oceani]
MTGPHDIDPDRLGELIDGATPTDADEQALVALVQQTRDLEPGAPDDLRRRVLDDARRAAATGDRPRRGIRALDPRRWIGEGGGDRRRRLLVAAPVVAGIVAVALIAIPALDDGGTGPSGGDAASAGATSDGTRLAVPAAPGAADSAAPAAPGAEADQGAPAPAPERAAAPAIATPAPGPVPDGTRLTNVTVRTRVQVADVDALSRASTSAMRTTRALGGYTASSDYGVPDGGRGTNDLVLRIPTTKVDQALAAFGRLGTVIGQDADIVDVTAAVATGDRGVTRAAEALADLRARAAADPADAALARRVVRAEAALARAEAAVAAQRERARLAVVSLTLTTEGPPAAPREEGRFAGPIGDSGDRLAGALAWLLGALVLIGPFALLAALAAWAAHRHRGRSARRLMGSA